eukprot:PLAT5260.3.p1 GENE.PLAT5260.3~~PLAT5260.3.p1  ORF type:complete len:425 (-),score=191.57 PLAT5260.3:204-1478(-)
MSDEEKSGFLTGLLSWCVRPGEQVADSDSESEDGHVSTTAGGPGSTGDQGHAAASASSGSAGDDDDDVAAKKAEAAIAERRRAGRRRSSLLSVRIDGTTSLVMPQSPSPVAIDDKGSSKMSSKAYTARRRTPGGGGSGAGKRRPMGSDRAADEDYSGDESDGSVPASEASDVPLDVPFVLSSAVDEMALAEAQRHYTLLLQRGIACEKATRKGTVKKKMLWLDEDGEWLSIDGSVKSSRASKGIAISDVRNIVDGVQTELARAAELRPTRTLSLLPRAEGGQTIDIQLASKAERNDLLNALSLVCLQRPAGGFTLASLDDDLRALWWLQRGVDVVKYSTRGEPQPRSLWLQATHTLCLAASMDKLKAAKTMPLSDLTDAAYGNPDGSAAEDPIATIVIGDRELVLELESVKHRDQLIDVLQRFI